MPATKGERLNLRLSSSDDALIREAAETSGAASVSDYVIQSAVRRAHQVLADQRHFELDDAAWDAFVAALDRPVKVDDRIVALLARPSLLDE